jgi:hypothetical protein
MRRFLNALMVISILSGVAACGDDDPARVEPDHVRTQHILIGFGSSVPGRPLDRTAAEAEALVQTLGAAIEDGADFGELVQDYSDDSFPGIYALSNTGITPQDGEYPRNNFVAAYGDVAFSLDPGEVGVATYHPVRSPYGWHIIKRLD